MDFCVILLIHVVYNTKMTFHLVEMEIHLLLFSVIEMFLQTTDKNHSTLWMY